MPFSTITRSRSWCPVQRGSHTWHRIFLPHLENAPAGLDLVSAHHRATKGLARVASPEVDRERVMVRSQIVKANGEPVNVDYMMRRNGNAWLISDIYLDGAISEVAIRRSEFAAILKSQGIDGLIAALNRKADILTATTAKAS